MSAGRSLPGSANGVASRIAACANRARSEISRTAFALMLGVGFVPTPGIAQDSLTRACDLAAATSMDPTRPAGIAGIDDPNNIDVNVALPACKAALAAAPNNPRLLFEMGRVYAHSDMTKAISFYKSAADQGSAIAQALLGTLYQIGRSGVPKNEQEAVRLYKLAADQGLALAQALLGDCYDNGACGLPKNTAEAVRLYKLAADQGIAAAQNNLGVDYMNGADGLPQNLQEAARLFKLAAAQGMKEAQDNLTDVEQRQSSKAEMATKLEAKKDVGDFVCAVDSEATIRDITFYTVAGYVENTHGDKLQIRVHHKGGLDEAPSDELIWKNYNEVIPCSPP